jgi:hypothetical protein
VADDRSSLLVRCEGGGRRSSVDTSHDDWGDLEKLAYAAYAETLRALLTANGEEELADVRRAIVVGTWIERKALGLALADYVAGIPLRTPEEFHAALPAA